MSQLAALIADETRLLVELEDLLRGEQALLKSGRPEGLADLATTKSTLIEQINRLEGERSQLTGQAELALTPEGMSAWLAAHPAETKAAAAWQQLLARARSAKEIHLQNGQLLSLLQKQTDAALDVLLQHQGRNALYGSDGQAAGRTGSRIVDSA
ncbi:MAG: flagellar protein FlgN [Dechloromonas sp.]|uniref:flagella synthesis protein FlgN n=1 Tax=Azonexus sp. TaxID=1872668 RepID=UPI0035B26E01|nr:flagellar protein FlgN [Dechloromonas sp.]